MSVDMGSTAAVLCARLVVALRRLPQGTASRACAETSRSGATPCLPCVLADHPCAAKMYYSLANHDGGTELAYDEELDVFVCALQADEETKRAKQLTLYRPEPLADAEDSLQHGQRQHCPLRLSWLGLPQRTLLTALSRRYVPHLHELAQAHGLRCRPGALCHVWVHRPHAALPNVPQVGPAYVLRPLGATHAELVNTRWTYGGSPASLRFIQHLLAMCRTMAAFQPDSGSDTPVCWALQQTYGAIGMVHTEPEHRRRGLARAVVRELSQRIQDDGQLAYAYITDDNAASQALFSELGFESRDPVDWWHVMPASQQPPPSDAKPA